MDLHTVSKSAVAQFHRKGINGKELHYIFAYESACSFCFKTAQDPKRCGGCKAAVYCSPRCAKTAWKKPSSISLPGRQGLTHKEECPKYQRYMERVPEINEIIGYFPWGHLAKDDTFPSLAFLVERGLLGSHGFGYWSSSPVLTPHDNDPDLAISTGFPGQMEQKFQETTKSSGYIHGYMLLSASHAPEKVGWHGIPDEQIPWYKFDSTHRYPACLEPGMMLKSWKEWYEWRKLPMESPVALVMHHVMSCYFMLTNSLGHMPLAPSYTGLKLLTIHFIGAEIELNCIPTFAELAFLLPGYDFKFVFYGPSVYKLTTQAAEKFPDSLATKDGPIFTYTAPLDLGGSKISVSLHNKCALWDHQQVAASIPWPDIVMGLNSAITRYPSEWDHLITAVIPRGIPFVTTEYTEKTLENYTSPQIEGIFTTMLRSFRDNEGGLRTMAGEEFHQKMEAKRNKPWEIKLNPFMMPGQKQVPNCRIPNANNGFVYEIIVSLEKVKQALG